jgi:predicted nucleotide-binding protein
MVEIVNLVIKNGNTVITEKADNINIGQTGIKDNKHSEPFQSMKLKDTTESIRDSIFIVHGRDDFNLRDVVARLLKEEGFDAIILDQKPNEGGLTIIEKFEKYASTAKYAIILLTPDDIGGLAPLNPLNLSPRARQNVFFEMGYLYGKLGRNKVWALSQEIEVPSDLQGILYIPIDKMGAWKRSLIEELEKAEPNAERV